MQSFAPRPGPKWAGMQFRLHTETKLSKTDTLLTGVPIQRFLVQCSNFHSC